MTEVAPARTKRHLSGHFCDVRPSRVLRYYSADSSSLMSLQNGIAFPPTNPEQELCRATGREVLCKSIRRRMSEPCADMSSKAYPLLSATQWWEARWPTFSARSKEDWL